MRSLQTVLLVVAGILPASGVAGEVWVADGSVRLDPVSGYLIEERHPSGQVSASYRSQNPVWNRSDGTIRLLAGGNEVVAFQVMVDGGSHHGVSLQIGDLQGPVSLDAATHVRRFKEWFLQVSQESSFCPFGDESFVASLGPGWYPDPLIPLDATLASGFGQPFDIPDARNRIPGQTAAAFWVDLLVPTGTPAGVYSGTVQVTVDGSVTSLPLQLSVRGFSLSSYNHAGLGSVNYGGLGFDVLYGPRGAAGLIPWFQMAHAHRLELDAHWLWPDWESGSWVDWQAWTAIWEPFLSGRAFTSDEGYWGPGGGEPIRRFTLPQDFHWPVDDNDGDDLPDDLAFWQGSLREAEAILIANGWTGVEAQLWIHPTDEPASIYQYDLITAYGALLDGAGLADRGNIALRVDTGNFKNVGDLIDGWDVNTIFTEIGDAVDVWCHVGSTRTIDATATLQRLSEHRQEQWWFYSSCCAGEPAIGSPVLEAEALGMRTWGWIVYRYRMQGAVTWEMDGGRSDIDATDCWTDPQCAGWGINGDAVLFYLGEQIGLDYQPVASIRVKNLRRGSQDHEYLRLLEQLDGNRQRADAIAATVLPRALDDGLDWRDPPPGRWAHTPAAFEDARHQVADLLDPVATQACPRPRRPGGRRAGASR